MSAHTKKTERKNGIILQYGGWIIRCDAHCYILHHVNDKKMNHAVFLSSLSNALQLLHEKILIERTKCKNYDGSIDAFRRALIETHREFEALLSPRIVRLIKEEQGGERK